MPATTQAPRADTTAQLGIEVEAPTLSSKRAEPVSIRYSFFTLITRCGEMAAGTSHIPALIR